MSRRLWAAALAAALCACAAQPGRSPGESRIGTGPDPGSIPTSLVLRRPGGFYTDDAPDAAPPANLDTLPEPVPRAEPLNVSANQPYTVFGREYVPLTTLAPYHRQGTASWYGRKFHGQKTSSGEVYDMFALTAAHPTLPIPSYARVTNLANQRSVVVRINDRGPWGSGRIMDVSYAAAHRLGFVEDTLANVEVEALLPERPVQAARTPAPRPDPPVAVPVATEASGIFLQLAAFSNPGNAETFSARIRRELDWVKEQLQVVGRNNLYRVQLGPYKTRALANAAAQRIREQTEVKPVVVTK